MFRVRLNLHDCGKFLTSNDDPVVKALCTFEGLEWVNLYSIFFNVFRHLVFFRQFPLSPAVRESAHFRALSVLISFKKLSPRIMLGSRPASGIDLGLPFDRSFTCLLAAIFFHTSSSVDEESVELICLLDIPNPPCWVSTNISGLKIRTT